jgi:hypothetical protein
VDVRGTPTIIPHLGIAVWGNPPMNVNILNKTKTQVMTTVDLQITSGSITKGGNLSGYSELGRIHIYGKQLKAAGFDVAKIDFPFWATVDLDHKFVDADLVGDAYIPKKDAEGNEIVVNRPTAVAVYKDEMAYFAPQIAKATAQAKLKKAIAKELEAHGITKEDMAEMVAQASGKVTA